MPKAQAPNGYILYQGPSNIDGKPIVVIATGFANKSANGKTGDMIQTWIIREDIAPNVLSETGKMNRYVASVYIGQPAKRRLKRQAQSISDATSKYGKRRLLSGKLTSVVYILSLAMMMSLSFAPNVWCVSDPMATRLQHRLHYGEQWQARL